MTLNNNQIYEIIKFRGLGYNQQEVADHIGVSRKTVENYLRKFRVQSKESGNIDKFYFSLLLGNLCKLFDNIVGAKNE